ncbi:MAG: HAMP domain-containing histidine kinase [Eubacterium sp.]|jgi:signal transduction histidine kinase|nr:HAMP domain-containing histidine kinase [Eubacterium sp.]MCH4046803.1 HAMP domain-containing histidine kinase [Eubacterium sp.]MCH4079900.1 HAMP domain-containing histidine kinase [Eubacterium sp.]MCH4110059.1 HAMP domain-containing histidine kinase [Eubacterium sp.]MCI1306519.1 HAMP domain-containing histidine kinase [Eubacterium sp.]
MERKKIDFHSIKFKLLAYFLIFAVVMMILVWFLQIFFLNHYYEDMKTKQTTRIADQIRKSYQKGHSLSALKAKIKDVSSEDDLTIFIRTRTGKAVTNKQGQPVDQQYYYDSRYEAEMFRLNTKLQTSSFGSISEILTSRVQPQNRTLEYAGFLDQGSSRKPISTSSYVMFIFSPLYPMQSTVQILQHQLLYIILIALVLALLMSILLSRHISQPIRQITGAAAKMSKGDMNVKFQGGRYSEIEELAETLNLAESEIERTGQYQQDLIANVSHDLRTPLTMIRSYAEMIRDLSGDNPEKRNKHLKVIIDESERLNALVNDMLTMSRMQSKRMLLISAPFDLNQAAADVMSTYEVMNDKENYNIIFQHPKNPLIVNADEAKIKQVMNNLMSNAVKYCGEDKFIRVTLKRSGRKVRFSVEDHGPGIPADELPHVWDKYYKASANHARDTKSTGLGLSIVKEILNLHKAAFDVDSTVGKGSTFWFELPLMHNTRNLHSRNGRSSRRGALNSGFSAAPHNTNTTSTINNTSTSDGAGSSGRSSDDPGSNQ